MESKELRIGNYVRNEELTIIKIEDGFDIDRSKWSEPIELTEDILSKYKYMKGLNGYIELINGKFFFKYFDLEIELPYLHTFQNLYFVLTNEELEINL